MARRPNILMPWRGKRSERRKKKVSRNHHTSSTTTIPSQPRKLILKPIFVRDALGLLGLLELLLLPDA